MIPAPDNLPTRERVAELQERCAEWNQLGTEHMDDLAAILRAYLRLTQENEWRPIESAPRDSRRILVGYYDLWGDWKAREAWWRMPYESAAQKDCWWCYDGDKTLLSADLHKAPDGKRLGATHWRPLPPPPVSPSENSTGGGKT